MTRKSRKNETQAERIKPRPSTWIGWKTALQIFLIVAVGSWIFSPAFHGSWIGDDALYITTNSLLSDPDRLWKAWFAIGSFIEYYPLEESLQWLEWRSFGDQTLGYHLVNTALHVTSSLLVWRLLSKFGLRLAWLGGLIFAVHPILVESVCIINEFKTVLALPPFLLAMGVWIDYEEARKWRYYFLALFLFTVAMLCKIILAPFPAVILLYAWWKRGKIGWGDVAATLPFLVISFGLVFTTVLAGERYAHIDFSSTTTEAIEVNGPDRPLLVRLALVGTTLAFYFSRCFWPSTPLCLYPQWPVSPPTLVHLLPWLALALILGWFWIRRGSWGRHALLGLGYFSLMLAPFLGFNWVSYMNATWAIDHFLYVPIVGMVGLTVAGLEDAGNKVPSTCRVAGGALVACALTVMAFVSHSYAKKFISDIELSFYTLRHNPGVIMVRYNLGVLLVNDHRFQEAMDQFRIVLLLDPGHPRAAALYSSLLINLGQVEQAIQVLSRAERLSPTDALVHYDLASAFLRESRIPEAIAQCREAEQCQAKGLGPNYDKLSLAPMLARLEQTSAEIARDQQDASVHPQDPVAHYRLGNAWLQNGSLDDAIEQFRQAIDINPQYAEVYGAYGNALVHAGRLADAIDPFRRAVDLNPKDAEARTNLGTVLLQSGQLAEALEQYQAAIKLNPHLAEAHANLGTALVETGRLSEGQTEYELALQIDPNNPTAIKNLERLKSLKN